MFWDYNFWENIAINVFAGLILLIIGGIVTYLFKNNISNIYNSFLEKTIISIKKEINQNKLAPLTYSTFMFSTAFNFNYLALMNAFTKLPEKYD